MAIRNKVCANCDTPATSRRKRVCRKCHGNIWREMTAEELARRDAQTWRIRQTFDSLKQEPEKTAEEIRRRQEEAAKQKRRGMTIAETVAEAERVAELIRRDPDIQGPE